MNGEVQTLSECTADPNNIWETPNQYLFDEAHDVHVANLLVQEKLHSLHQCMGILTNSLDNSMCRSTPSTFNAPKIPGRGILILLPKKAMAGCHSLPKSLTKLATGSKQRTYLLVGCTEDSSHGTPSPAGGVGQAHRGILHIVNLCTDSMFKNGLGGWSTRKTNICTRVALFTAITVNWT